MKKTLSLVLAICISMLLVVPAFADGRGPTFTSYDVVCKTQVPYYTEDWENDGAMVKKGTFPSGTELTVQYEYEKDGVTYGEIRWGYGDNEKWGFIRIADVELKSDSYLPENTQKLQTPRSVRVIAKGGVPLYAGPNKKYPTVINIPRGTKLTYSYANDEDVDYCTWAYVTYLNRSGWVYVYVFDTDNGVAQMPDDADTPEIWVLEDGVQMYDGISFGNMEDELPDDWKDDAVQANHREPDRVVGTLEKGKKYTYRYSHAQAYGTWYYVVAGLRAGWVFKSSYSGRVAVRLPESMREQFLAYRTINLKLHAAPSEKASTQTVKVDKGTTLSPVYSTSEEYTDFYYETIRGQSGWYSSGDTWDLLAHKLGMDSHELPYNELAANENRSSVPIYSDIVKKNKAVGSIPPEKFFRVLYRGEYQLPAEDGEGEWTSFYYVRYNDVTGWVDMDDLYTTYTEETTAEPETETYSERGDEAGQNEENTYNEETDIADEDMESDEPIAAQQSGMTPMQIVLLCVGGAAVLALTAGVTLLLIRRKRRAKTPVQPDEPVTREAETATDDDPPDDPSIQA